MKINEARFNHWGLIQWKTLTWAQYKKFEESSNQKGPMAVANDIYRACLITGPSVYEATSGIVEFVVKSVYKNSSFSGSYEVINTKLIEARNKFNDNFLYSARAVVSSLFGYSFEEIDTWDEDTFLLRVAQAEFVAGKPLQLGSPEEVLIEDKTTPINTKKPIRNLTDAQRLVMDRMRDKK